MVSKKNNSVLNKANPSDTEDPFLDLLITNVIVSFKIYYERMILILI